MEIESNREKLPWEGRISLFEYLKSEDDQELPDHAPLRGDWGFYDPGYDDYWDIYANPPKDVNPLFINKLIDLYLTYTCNNDLKAKVAFYKMVKDNPIIGYYETFFQELESKANAITMEALEFIYWMVRKAPDREVVKLGIIFMGRTHLPMFLPTLKTIGMHPEFTYYVAQALYEITSDWEEITIELTKPLWNFGRLLSVIFLMQNYQREETRNWCIRHGFQNLYDEGFIVLDCMNNLDVVNDLREENWDEPLINAVQVMIRNIVRSPIEETECGGEIIYLYVKQFVGKKRGYVHYLVLEDLLNFFDQIAENKKLLDVIHLSEDKYSDIWIDVKNDTQKTWFQSIRDMRGKEFDTYPYSIEERCKRAYEDLLYEKLNYNIEK